MCPTDGESALKKISDFVASSAESIEKIALLLDQKSKVNKNWFHLGVHFKVPNKSLKEIEYGQYHPTIAVMEYLYATNPDLTIGAFYDKVEELKRNDVLEILSPVINNSGEFDSCYTGAACKLP